MNRLTCKCGRLSCRRPPCHAPTHRVAGDLCEGSGRGVAVEASGEAAVPRQRGSAHVVRTHRALSPGVPPLPARLHHPTGLWRPVRGGPLAARAVLLRRAAPTCDAHALRRTPRVRRPCGRLQTRPVMVVNSTRRIRSVAAVKPLDQRVCNYRSRTIRFHKHQHAAQRGMRHPTKRGSRSTRPRRAAALAAQARPLRLM